MEEPLGVDICFSTDQPEAERLRRMEELLDKYYFRIVIREDSAGLVACDSTRLLISQLDGDSLHAGEDGKVFWARSPFQVGEWKSFSRLHARFNDRLVKCSLPFKSGTPSLSKPYVVTCSRTLGEAVALFVCCYTSPAIVYKPYPFGFPDFYLGVKLPALYSVLICGVYDVNSKWNGFSAAQLVKEIRKGESSLRWSVDRLFTYMSIHGHYVGILSSSKTTWFCARLGKSLWLSEPVSMEGNILKAHCMCLYYALKLHDAPKACAEEQLELKSLWLVKVPGSSSRKDQLMELMRELGKEVGATWCLKQVTFTVFSDGDIGQCLFRSNRHQVFQGRENVSTVYKITDLSAGLSFREALKSFITEVEVYKRLESLQGKAVPKLLGFGFHVGSMFTFLALERARGTRVRPLEGVPTWAAQVGAEHLEEIHARGVLHGSLKNDDILVNAYEKEVKIVGFSRAQLKQPCFSKMARSPTFGREVDSLVQTLSLRVLV